jgi:hypothetical protein
VKESEEGKEKKTHGTGNPRNFEGGSGGGGDDSADEPLNDGTSNLFAE